MCGNGYVYETFGISKQFLVKLQLLLKRAETFDNPLTAECFIYDVTTRTSFISLSMFIIFFKNTRKIILWGQKLSLNLHTINSK